jgi:hypothetical protein
MQLIPSIRCKVRVEGVIIMLVRAVSRKNQKSDSCYATN